MTATATIPPHLLADWDSFHVCLSLLHVLERTEGLNTKKVYERFVRSLLDRMCRDRIFRELVLSTGGECRIWTREDGTVVKAEMM